MKVMITTNLERTVNEKPPETFRGIAYVIVHIHLIFLVKLKLFPRV